MPSGPYRGGGNGHLAPHPAVAINGHITRSTPTGMEVRMMETIVREDGRGIEFLPAAQPLFVFHVHETTNPEKRSMAGGGSGGSEGGETTSTDDRTKSQAIVNRPDLTATATVMAMMEACEDTCAKRTGARAPRGESAPVNGSKNLTMMGTRNPVTFRLLELLGVGEPERIRVTLRELPQAGSMPGSKPCKGVQAGGIFIQNSFARRAAHTDPPFVTPSTGSQVEKSGRRVVEDVEIIGLTVISHKPSGKRGKETQIRTKITDDTCRTQAAKVLVTNGGVPKLRNGAWTNGGPQDHQSTLSRPRSAEVITANGNGTLPNGRHNASNGGGVLSRGPGGLHEDLEFPPAPRTLSKKKQIVWMRPHVRTLRVRRGKRTPSANRLPISFPQDMCARPQFRIAPPGTPLTARELPEPVGPGDPSLLAALGCLSQLPRLLERVVPPEQTFDAANGYCGMFK
ncbi:hypothetical protein AND_002833 [Anopheles darlingi]|uniref:Uncharacterized protein n=1 Tax=Anopheles darlingi TaxID=43151 RepID=W5JRP9_ANODA|nr:hypothetical protein AND_002833 [Anopheles darlingi]